MNYVAKLIFNGFVYQHIFTVYPSQADELTASNN